MISFYQPKTETRVEESEIKTNTKHPKMLPVW